MQRVLSRPFGRLLNQKLEEMIPTVRDRVKNLQKSHGDKVVDQVKIGNIVGGMRDMPVMFYVGSQLDAQEGIRMRGNSIPEMTEMLPKVETEMIPEAVFWMLLTGKAPSEKELAEMQKDIISTRPLPKSTQELIENYATAHHPMTTLSMAIMDMQRHSAFASGYANNTLKKADYWQATLTDGLFLLKFLPQICALIYTTKFNRTALTPQNSDWAGIYSELLGFKDPVMAEALRGYLSIHTDHEGGNVSAHTSWLVNSALSDPFLSVSAAVNGLAGPLHGLANQEVLKFLMTLQEHLHYKKVQIASSSDPSLLQAIEDFTNDWLKKAVVPGYGHAKLRNTDPRFTFLKEQSLRYLPDKELVKLVHACEQVIPQVLKKLGKVKNPYPNVDSHSGVILYELGMTEFDYYTVVFALSRSMGCIANMVWARALGLPIERPGSLTLEKLEELAQQN